MQLIAIDGYWDDVTWTSDGHTTHEDGASLEQVLGRLQVSHAVVCEPTFYDGLRDVRDALREVAARRGHRFIPVGPTAKAVLESAAGDWATGSGVTRLHAIVASGYAQLDFWRTRRHPLWDIRDALDVVHAIDLVADPGQILRQALEAVGPYAALTTDAQHALGDGLDYARDVLLVGYRAATLASSRDAFERMLGFGAGPVRGASAHTIRAWYQARNTREQSERESVLTWSDYRRAMRLVFQRVAAARRSDRAAA